MRNLFQYLCPISVKTDVLVEGMGLQPLGVFLTTDIGDDGTAEIERFVLLVEDDLGRIGIEERALEITICPKGFHQRCYLRSGIGEAAFQGFDLLWMDEGLVALDVDHDIVTSPTTLIGLVATIRATAMAIGGHHYLTAKLLHGLLDACVICSYTDRI